MHQRQTPFGGRKFGGRARGLLKIREGGVIFADFQAARRRGVETPHAGAFFVRQSGQGVQLFNAQTDTIGVIGGGGHLNILPQKLSGFGWPVIVFSAIGEVESD